VRPRGCAQAEPGRGEGAYDARIRRLVLPLVLGAALAAAGAARATPLTVAAYYYPWFAPGGARWDAGYLRSQLAAPEVPALGQYVSSDPAVIAQHYAWAHQYGVDAFFASWDGPGTFSDRTISADLLPSPARGPTQVALLYESRARFALAPDGLIHLDDAGVSRLVADFDAIARTYFGRPGYYEIGGRPVVIVYASRIFRGPFADAIHEIRRRLEATYGVDPYLIGDEVDWDDPPDPARIALFDAITGYTPYSIAQPAGWPGRTDYLESISLLMLRFRAVAAAEGVAFVPDAVPGYNDRGERLAEDHHVLPRQYAAGADPASLFDETLGLAAPLVDPQLGLLAVTSWNEWGEDTQIEPTAPAGPSDGPAALTQGYPYVSYGTSLLEHLARFGERWDEMPPVGRLGRPQAR
jgi:glycoprotein endo-alpha-1,2-mannosidase